MTPLLNLNIKQKKKSPNESLQQIRCALDEIKPNRDNTRHIKTRANSKSMIRSLEKDFDTLDSIGDKYKKELIILL